MNLELENAIPKNKNIIVCCPHCNENILIEELNCCIFRHGVFTKNKLQINQHAPQQLCEYYIKHNMILGCGKPFKIVKKDNVEYIAVICDYI